MSYGEIQTKGYEDLRQYIKDNWEYISLRDEDDTEVVRLDPSDERVEWKDFDVEDQELVLEVTVRGDDGDIPTPTTFKYSELYKTGSGGDTLSRREITETAVEEDDDEMTIRHAIQVPKVD